MPTSESLFPLPHDTAAADDQDHDKAVMSSAAWNGPHCSPVRTACRPLLAYLATNLLLGHAGVYFPLRKHIIHREDIADLLEVPELARADKSVESMRAALLRRHESGRFYPQGGGIPTMGPCVLQRNLAWITATAQLHVSEQRLLELGVLLRFSRSFSQLFIDLGEHSQSDIHYMLSALLQLDFQEVQTALLPTSLLTRCGLLHPWSHGLATLDNMVRVPRSLLLQIEQHRGEPDQLLSKMLLPLRPSALHLDDFAYIRTNTELAKGWLLGNLHETERAGRGRHMLVGGLPGLGKTEWIRALLGSIPVTAMELGLFDHSGHELTGMQRLEHLYRAVHFMQHTPRGVLVFDEADDVFSQHHGEAGTGDSHSGVSMRTHRASLNRFLENSPIPVIWIMNDPEVLDPAVLRRFDVLIRFAPMPQQAKRAMLEEKFGKDSPHPIESTELQLWAGLDALTPALIAKLAEVRTRAHEVGVLLDEAACRAWLVQRFASPARLKLPPASKGAGETWNPDTVHASMDLAVLTQGIRQHPHARVLLYGIPGTGKTAYANALAQALGRPLHEHRTSDLLSAFVGESEAQVHAAFQQAHRDEAVLFLDEADGLLASREGASRNWEVTLVNELLLQLHDFEGVVVLATNRLEYLDEAVLRRMDAKVELLPLRPPQALALLQQCLAAISGPAAQQGYVLTPQQHATLHRLNPLTTGDFVMLQRRMRFAPPQGPTPEAACTELLQLLEQELRLKTRGKPSIGFVPDTNSRDVNATPRPLL